jgi:DNA-directed RNA polymerase subunit omega
MLDAFKEEQIVNKVGGRFKLSALIQKRMVALNRGARPLVELQTKNLMEIVVAEILNDKIYLDTSGAVRERSPLAALDGGPSPEDAGPSLADL